MLNLLFIICIRFIFKYKQTINYSQIWKQLKTVLHRNKLNSPFCHFCLLNQLVLAICLKERGKKREDWNQIDIKSPPINIPKTIRGILIIIGKLEPIILLLGIELHHFLRRKLEFERNFRIWILNSFGFKFFFMMADNERMNEIKFKDKDKMISFVLWFRFDVSSFWFKLRFDFCLYCCVWRRIIELVSH